MDVEAIDVAVGEATCAVAEASAGAGAGAGAGSAGAGVGAAASSQDVDAAHAVTKGSSTLLATCPCRVDGVAFNGSQLGVACSNLEGKTWDGRALVYDAAGGAAAASAIATESGATGVDWVNDTRMACSCDNGDVLVLEPSSNKRILKLASTLGEHQSVASGVSVCRATSAAASASWDATVKVWDLSGAASRSTAALTDHCGRVFAVQWNAAGSCVASGSEDCTVKLWDPRGASELITIGAGSPVTAVAWHPLRTTQVAVGMEDGRVLLFDSRAASAACSTGPTHKGCVYAIAFNEEGTMATGSDDTTVCISREGGQTTFLGDHTDYVRALTWLSNTQLVSGAWDNTMRSWAVEAGAAGASDASATDAAGAPPGL